jgi:hypothetical protein
MNDEDRFIPEIRKHLVNSATSDSIRRIPEFINFPMLVEI